LGTKEKGRRSEKQRFGKQKGGGGSKMLKNAGSNRRLEFELGAWFEGS
jgi:hypothetical protein